MFEPYTPEWWLDRLIVELGNRRQRYEMLDGYVRSNPPAPPKPAKGKSNAAFDYLRKISRVNWADIIVESVVERMNLLRFRTPTEDVASALWKMWSANDLDTIAGQLYRAKGTMGEAYVIVGPVDETLGAPRVTCEDPRQVITEMDPVDKRTPVAALKVFVDRAAKLDRAYLYLPNPDDTKPALLYRATRPRRDDTEWLRHDTKPVTVDGTSRGWEFEDPEELATVSIPVVWYPNRADLFGRTQGEFEHLVDDLQRIALMVLQRVQVAVLQAFRQRAIKGDLPERDAEGNLIDYNVLLSSDPDALWTLPNGVELWESSGVDLTPILESVKADVRDLAARGRVPLYYLYPNEGGSAEGAATQREGLVFRAGSRIKETSGPHTRTASLMLEAAGSPVPAKEIEAVWLRPDLATLSERYDAASKARAVGVSLRTVLTDILQFTPQEAAAEMAQAPEVPAP